jgi:hypothetical protein
LFVPGAATPSTELFSVTFTSPFHYFQKAVLTEIQNRLLTSTPTLPQNDLGRELSSLMIFVDLFLTSSPNCLGGGWRWGSNEEAPDVCPPRRFLVPVLSPRLSPILAWPLFPGSFFLMPPPAIVRGRGCG